MMSTYEYILFIDTETSGIPKNLNAPYSAINNWPYNVQVAWVIYDYTGREIKSENHYIKALDFHIDPKSIGVHGLTKEFLIDNGENRSDVFKILSTDLEMYKPLMVGHFMQFDFHMLSLGFKRSGIPDLVTELPKFCTMKATKIYTRSLLQPRLLRLDELYRLLFKKNLTHHHNAYWDARATGECFFEMMKRGDILSTDIDRQDILISSSTNPIKFPKTIMSQIILYVLMAILVIIGLTILL